jgi:hypothetical protein
MMTQTLSNLEEKNREKSKCVFEPVTAKFPLAMFLNAKRNVSSEVIKKWETLKISLEKLC